MEALRCTLCNGPLVMDESGEFALCEYCGTKYKSEALKKLLVELKGAVEVKGNRADDYFERASTFMSLKEYAKAFDAYRKASDIYPNQYRSWWGMIAAATENFQKTADNSGMKQLDVWAEHMRQVAEGKAETEERIYALYKQTLEYAAAAGRENELAEVAHEQATGQYINWLRKKRTIRKSLTWLLWVLFGFGIIMFAADPVVAIVILLIDCAWHVPLMFSFRKREKKLLAYEHPSQLPFVEEEKRMREAAEQHSNGQTEAKKTLNELLAQYQY